MSVKIKHKTTGVIAEAKNYFWVCSDKNKLRLLNTLIDKYGPSGSDPNPDYSLCLEACRKFGFEMVTKI